MGKFSHCDNVKLILFKIYIETNKLEKILNLLFFLDALLGILITLSSSYCQFWKFLSSMPFHKK